MAKVYGSNRGRSRIQRVGKRGVAERTETLEQTTLRPVKGIVSTLPSNPFDGQEIRYQNAAMVTAGIVWSFKYRSAASGSYKWEFVGGSAWINEVATSETTSGAIFQDLATVGPTLTIPLAGEYVVSLGSVQDLSAATATRWIRMGVMVNAVEAVDTFIAGSGHTVTLAKQSASRTGVQTYAASDVLKARYKTTADTARFEQRWLSITPKCVG